MRIRHPGLPHEKPGKGSTARDTARTIVITGASDGIGAAAAELLAARGHRLLLVGRSRSKLEEVARQTGGESHVADFMHLDDVRRLVDEVAAATDRVDALANNAGAVFGSRMLTPDGHEATLQVNYLAAFLLTLGLRERLAAGDGVVVNTSSATAKLFSSFDISDLEGTRNYSPVTAYSNSKMANILHAKELSSRFGLDGIRAVSFDPGIVRTNLASENNGIMRLIHHSAIPRFFLASARRGAQSLVHFLEGTPGTTWQPGAFYARTNLASRRQKLASFDDAHLSAELWDRSVDLVGESGM